MIEEAGINWTQVDGDYQLIRELEYKVKELREAAEFEARVAEKLATRVINLEIFIQQAFGAAKYFNPEYAAEDLCKKIRMQVEEEMDAESQ